MHYKQVMICIILAYNFGKCYNPWPTGLLLLFPFFFFFFFFFLHKKQNAISYFPVLLQQKYVVYERILQTTPAEKRYLGWVFHFHTDYLILVIDTGYTFSVTYVAFNLWLVLSEYQKFHSTHKGIPTSLGYSSDVHLNLNVII